MKKFPDEFDAILNCDIEDLVNSSASQIDTFNSLSCTHNKWDRKNLCSFGNVLDQQKVKGLVLLLDSKIYPLFEQNHAKQHTKIPKGYSQFYEDETVPYSCRFRARNIDYDEDEDFYNLSMTLGLLHFINSESLRIFIARCSGERLRFGTGAPYGQILCYEDGDYIGPHSDWLPSLDESGNFIVCHINLPNKIVNSQLFIYEEDGFLNQNMQNSEPSVSVFRPPFWHMTSPLQGNKSNQIARRWLIAISFRIR